MPSRVIWFVLMLVARLYRNIWNWLSLVVARRFGRKNWLRVGPIWFMDVISRDGPVTIDLGWIMCRGVVVIAVQPFAL